MKKFYEKWIMTRAHAIIARSEQEQKKSNMKELAMNSIQLVGASTSKHYQGGDRLDSSPDINFKMYKAENGYIMEVRVYDKRTDRHTNNLHVIGADQDLGTAISHIITVESLKV